MQLTRLPLLAIAATMVLAACENGPRWGDRPERAAQTRADFGPTAAYERRLVFLGPGQRLPTAAVMDFIAVSDSEGLRRGARARVADGTEWHALLDAGWETEPMRDPWRLTPHGPLKLMVGDGGELTAVVLRLDPEVRLEPGPPLAEHSPDAGTQLVIRQGRLAIGGELVPGVILDAQLGRQVAPEEAARGRRMVAGEDGERGNGATPAALPGTEAMLLDNAGYYAVFASSAAGRLAWIHQGGRSDVRRGARLEPASWEAAEGGVQVPTSWRVVSTGGELSGELHAETAEGVSLVYAPDVEALGYSLVSGWIEDRSARREVFGLVRHVR